ncbi:acyltransferase [Rhizobium tubonense]|uniref:Acetyltransferase n=1 Tax=Rhizobium tubonense TaxID=484088 RepID=A0A2W4CAX7_9HYPH|nr:acyltransferase [Rhizobium tubonense]PZM08498.1 acetyltransferase [Rhizobium tubonense]
MTNFSPLYRLKALLSRGALRFGRRPKIYYLTRFRWGTGSISIGDKLSLQSGVVIDAQSGRIEIGDHVSLNDHAVLLGHGGITIGNDVRIAANVVVASFDHNFDDVSTPIRLQGVTGKPIVIEEDVWIGAGAKILGGSHIGKGCVIGANAVVKGPTIPFGIYVGNPAYLLKMRGEASRPRSSFPFDMKAMRG